MAELRPPAEATPARPGSGSSGADTNGSGPSFRVLLTVGLVVSAVLPVAVFGGIVLAARLDTDEQVMVPLLIGAIVAAAFFGLLVAAVAVAGLTAPLRRITTAVERVAAGEPGPPIHLAGDDELARLAESHNRIAAEAGRRNRELAALLTAIAGYNPARGVEALRSQAESDACAIYGLIDCRLRLGDPGVVPVEESIPGDPRPVRAEVRAGGETLGVLTGHLPATRDLGARRPGPARPVRQRGRRGPAQRRAVRPDREPERPAARARRGQGRVPARRQPQPPDAADQHPGLRRPAPRHVTRRPRKTAGCRSWPSRPTG